MLIIQTGECVIANNRIAVNGQTVFEQEPGGYFDAFAKAAFKNLNAAYPKFYKMDKQSKLGFLAAEYLLAGNTECCVDESTAIVLCNSSGSLESDLAHLRNAEQPSPAIFVYTLPNIVAGEIAIRHGIKGETAFFISRHENDPIVRQYATNLLENGMTNLCIAGWVEYAEERYLAWLYLMTSRE